MVTKGQHLRVLIGGKCVAAAQSCNLQLQLQLEETTSKDSTNDFAEYSPVGINWSGSVDALVSDGHYEEVAAIASEEVPASAGESFYAPQVISLPAGIAIAIIAVGVVGIGYLENSGDLRRQKRLGKKLAVIAFCMPFLYATIDALGCVLDIAYLEMETSPLLGVTEENIELIANVSYELTFAIVGLIMFIFMKVKGVKFGSLMEQKDKGIAAVCETAGQLTYVYAMSGNGAIAAPILSSVCVVSLLLSRIFLKEKLTRKQYLFIAIIIIGILMLAVIEGE